jgi:mono/diheme cytochrome c family protein
MNMKIHSFSRVVLALACAAIPVTSIAADTPAKTAAKPAKSVPATASNKEVERGRYLVMITGCNDCHTPDFLVNGGKTPEKDRLTGGTMGWRGPWGTTYPANLRLYFNDMAEDQWVQVAREIQRRPPMPYFSLNAMTEADVRAIYKYMRHLGPAGTLAPKFVPPDKEPPQPYVQFPAKGN